MSLRKLTCKERDNMLGDYSDWHVGASLTDAYGRFGEPLITTTWGRGQERIEDIRHPHHGEYAPTVEDREPCEHYYWIEEKDD